MSINDTILYGKKIKKLDKKIRMRRRQSYWGDAHQKIILNKSKCSALLKGRKEMRRSTCLFWLSPPFPPPLSHTARNYLIEMQTKVFEFWSLKYFRKQLLPVFFFLTSSWVWVLQGRFFVWYTKGLDCSFDLMYFLLHLCSFVIVLYNFNMSKSSVKFPVWLHPHSSYKCSIVCNC